VSTALVRVEIDRSQAAGGQAAVRPRADFLAQLIATVKDLPQTRARRRAETGEAIAAYGARGGLVMPPRPALSRSL
jgi:hypothetical protein